ncbi:MAG: hypothetical protein JWN46_1397 [Acidimicrobiales bacterium]|nr:hypothetical protein [Acidimicrobiales bacterium]
MISDHPTHVDLDLQVRARGSGPAAVVRLRGALDAASADQLLRMGERLIAAGRRHLVLDCSGLDFCDPHGLRAALALAALVRPDGRITLEHPPRLLERLLQITGTGVSFEVTRARPLEPCPWPDRSWQEAQAAQAA